MKRALLFALLTAMWAGEACLGQSGAKQEMVPAPLRSPSAPAVPAHPSPYNFPGVQYPRIEADSRVTFHFKAPGAQKVQVAIRRDDEDTIGLNGQAFRDQLHRQFCGVRKDVVEPGGRSSYVIYDDY